MERRVLRRGLVVLIAMTWLATQCPATTWRVEKDGTGDFTIIQDALDAAADGDTVRVGPGRFGDFLIHTRPQDNFQFYGIAWITRDVVLLGAGMDLTAIAPPSELVEISGLSTRGVLVDEGANAYVEGFTIEKMRYPATILNTSTWARNRIRTTQTYIGMLLLSGDQVRVSDGEFSGDSMLLTGSPNVTSPRLERCNFVGNGTIGRGVEVGNGATDAQILDCTFQDASIGIIISLSSSATIERCAFKRLRSGAIDLSQGAAIVRNCRIEPGANYSLRVNIGLLEVYDTVIGGGVMSTILTWGDMIVRDSHILNGGALTVDSRGSASRVIDLQSNWWGTTDLGQINGWISNLNSTVIVEPILDHPVPTASTSFGGVKAKF